MPTRYRISVGPVPRSWATGIDLDGAVRSWTGRAKDGAVWIDQATAEASANRLGRWLVAHGYPDAARSLRLHPATGGAATGWRFRESQPACA